MALYFSSWTILLAPLFSFAAILFGTRVWDMFSRSPALVAGERGEETLERTHAPESEQGLDDDEDPKVPHLTLGAKMSGYVGIVLVALACLYSWILLLNTAGVIALAPPLPQGGLTVLSYDWLRLGTTSYSISFHLDSLAIVMMVVVTSISLLVQIYSQGYMENSAGYARFYAYLSLFTFSMLTIVFAENFLVLFVGWELVGLSSYLLIGFWINKRARPAEDRPSPASAAIQAFITNRVGDVGFLIGILILFVKTGTFQFSELAARVPVMDKGLLTLAMILVFCGAIGKSAQVPLHIWLPSAMEGPTPVSALIHAATMVAAGVYMVARTFPLFAAANPLAFQVVAWIGGITALFAASIALVQYDLKRVLAFSTISQLGYMFVGLGVAGSAYGPGPGMFHLFTNAFFKALLFLGAGSVLIALHTAMQKEVQDMRLMGGLGSRLPVTAITFLIAALSLAGFPFFAGFYSKDTIIALAFDRGDYGLWGITLVTAGLTAFYMLRAFLLTFGGKGGVLGGLWGGHYRGTGEPRESPWTMIGPLMLLALPSMIAGYWFGFFRYLQPGAPLISLGAFIGDWKTWLGVAVVLVGLAWAYLLYARVEFARIEQYVLQRPLLRVWHRLLLHHYYVEAFYTLLIRYVVFGLSHIEQAFDTTIVDGLVNGTAHLVTAMGRGLRRVETGKVQTYMVGFFGGVAVLAVLVMLLVTWLK
jgi:NADH-quinone oxidoreductase subunit L